MSVTALRGAVTIQEKRQNEHQCNKTVSKHFITLKTSNGQNISRPEAFEISGAYFSLKHFGYFRICLAPPDTYSIFCKAFGVKATYIQECTVAFVFIFFQCHKKQIYPQFKQELLVMDYPLISHYARVCNASLP